MRKYRYTRRASSASGWTREYLCVKCNAPLRAAFDMHICNASVLAKKEKQNAY